MRVVIRAEFLAPTTDWFELVDLTYAKVKSESVSEVSTAPGPYPGSIDWFFDDDKDACWFLLQYGGEDVTEEWQGYWVEGLTTKQNLDTIF